MVTPSLVTSGEPVIFSRITLRPFGPSVLFTAAASCSTPACSSRRASAPKRSSLAMGPPGPLGVDGVCAGWTGRSRPDAGPPAGASRPATWREGSAPLQCLEVEADVLGGVLGIGEHDRAVVLVDHAAVVGRHALLEVGGAERPLLLAECLGELVVEEVHPGVGVDADHRRQVGHGDAGL